ncbi:MAG: DUF4266 domain-containing protein [Betaproteobacteria bacterium]|nr:DUF4266 domain-containing protein [Betaproteobacteria bacterium]
MTMMKALLKAGLPALLAAFGGCALAPQVPVAAFEKGDLARPAMQFDADRLEASFGDHIYFSKEGASGGRSVGGGGCGCN